MGSRTRHARRAETKYAMSDQDVARANDPEQQRSKEIEWFHRGAKAVYPYLIIPAGAHPPPLYACPECLSLFPENSVTDRTLPHEKQLTAEHVPPEKVGGRVLLLTCKPCNNGAGTRLDADADRAERMLQLRAGSTQRPIPSKLTFPGVGWVIADVEVSKEREWLIQIRETGAPTQHVADVRREFDEQRTNGSWEMSFTFEAIGVSFSRLAAETSWLRVAYLATFAQFGYSIIRDPVYEDIRRQIREPSSDLGLRRFIFASPPPDRWGFIVVPVSSPWPGILVLMGRKMVHLPFPGDREFWPRLHDLAQRGEEVTFQGAFRPWPTEPVFELDFWLQARSAS